MKLGTNQDIMDGYIFSTPFQERFVGAPNNSWNWTASAFGADQGAVPLANLDSNKWVNSLPGAGAYIKRTFYPELSTTYTMTWTGDFSDHFWDNAGNLTENSYDPVGRTLVFTTKASWVDPVNAPFLTFHYTFTGTPPKNIRVVSNADDGTRFTPLYLTESNKYNGPKRYMKWVAAENNGLNALAWGGGTSASPIYQILWSGRNVPTGGTWRSEYGGDGVPIEVIVEDANAYAGDSIHLCIPYASEDLYITNVATYVRDNLSAGKTIYVEFGNETSFNGVYRSQQQCVAEGLDATTTAGVAISSIVKGTPFSLSTTCNITSGSKQILGLANSTGVVNGMTISGTGIPAGTVIVAANGDHPTMSQAATATTTGVAVTITGCPATVTTSTPHGLISTLTYASSGASPSDYNIPSSSHVTVTVLNSTSFTIMCATTPATDATVMGAYTHNIYPNLGVGQMVCYLRYIHASKRCADIWTSVFSGQTSRIKPVLCWQHVDAGNTATALNYANGQGWLTPFKAYASAPYWGFHSYDKTYTGTASVALIDARVNVDTNMFNNAVLHKANADLYGWEYIGYEGDYGQDINSAATRQAVKIDPEMYNTSLYFYQKMQLAGFSKIATFNFCQPISPFDDTGSGQNDTIYGHIFPSLLGATYDKTHLPARQAVIDYIAGVRTPLHLATTGLTVVVGSTNGASFGTITGKDPNSTLSLAGLYGNDGGIAAIDGSSGAVTMANTSLLTATGTRNITVRDTNPGYPAPGYADTNFTYTATPAPIADNFDGTAGALDAAKWVQDSGFILASGQSTTGITISQDGSQAHIVWGSPGGVNHGNAFRSVNTTDFTLVTTQYAKFGPDNNPDGYERSFIMGNPGGLCITMQYADGSWIFFRWLGGSSTSMGSSGTGHALASFPYCRFRYTTASGGTIFADYSADGSSWTQIGSVTVATLQALGTFDPTALYIGFGAWHGPSGNIGSSLGIDCINTTP